MWRRFLPLMGCLTLVGVTVASGKLAGAQRGKLDLKIEDVMTSQDLKDTGLSGLTAPQRTALNIWLNAVVQPAQSRSRNHETLVAGSNPAKWGLLL